MIVYARNPKDILKERHQAALSARYQADTEARDTYQADLSCDPVLTARWAEFIRWALKETGR